MKSFKDTIKGKTLKEIMEGDEYVPAYEYEEKMVHPKDRERLTHAAKKAAFHYSMANKGPYSFLDDEDRKHFHKRGISSGNDFADAVSEFVAKYPDHPGTRYEKEAIEDMERNPHDRHGAAYTYCDKKGLSIPHG